MDPEALTTFLRDAGVIGVLVIIIVGGIKKLWVWGWQYREMEKDRDFWRDTALRALNISEAAVSRRNIE